MAYAAKTVNPEEGKIRIRFETLSKRMSRINVDIIHKKTDSFSLQDTRVTPDSGDMGCFLLDEIERLKTLDTSPMFKKLCYELGNYSQSLPELMHHQQRVIKLLIKYIKETPANCLESAFSLISVLGRDLKEDMNPHFHLLFGALVNATHSVAMSGGTTPNDCIPNPELTGKLFETIAYLLKSNLVTLMEQPDELSAYYGILLGSSVEFVRKFAAKAFSMVFRKLSTQVFKAHVKKIMKSVAVNFKSALNDDLSLLYINEDYREMDQSQHTNGVRRTKYLIEGLSQLFYYCFKGIHGQLHSKATKKLQLLYQLLFGALGKADDEVSAVSKGSQEKDKLQMKSSKSNNSKTEEKKKQLNDLQIMFNIKSYAAIIYRVTNLLHRQIFFQCQGPLLDVNFEFIESSFEKMENSSQQQSLSCPMKNLLWEISGKMFLMIVTAGNGRAFRDERIKEAVMKRVLDMSVRVMKWTKTCCTEDYIYSDDTNTRRNITTAFDVAIQVWFLYPQNMVFSARCEEIFQGCLHVMSPKPAILYFAEAFFYKLPGSIVGKCILPVLAKALLNLKNTLDHELWLKLVNQFLFKIKDFRENSDQLLQLQSTDDKNVNARQDFYAAEDGDLSDDEDDDGNDEDNVNMNFKGGKSHPTKGKNDSSNQKRNKNKKNESDRSHKKRDNNYSTAAPIVPMDVSIADKHLYANESLQQLQATIRSELLKELKKIKFSKTEEVEELRINLILQLSATNWFCQCLPNTVFGTETEKPLLSAVMEAINKKITTKSFENLCLGPGDGEKRKKTTSWFLMTFHQLFQLFTTMSAKCLEQEEVRTTVVQWLKCLVGYLTKHPQSIIVTSALSNLLQTFHNSISDSPRHFLSQLITGNEEDGAVDAFVSSLGLSLATPSYWLRLYTIRILEFIEPPIDEATQSHRQHEDHDNDDDEPAVYDVASLLTEIIRTPIQLSQEREIIRRLEMLEVLCRGEKLPKSFLTVICGFSLGLFHVKFKSLWSFAIQILNTIAQSAAGEEILWPMLSAALVKAQLPNDDNLSLGDSREEDNGETVGFDLVITQSLTTVLERDHGIEPILSSAVRSIMFPIKFGEESRHLPVQPDSRTDQQTVCLMLFELLKKTPLITLKRSKTIVPSFISFLQHQYYRCFSEESEILPLTYLGLLSKEREELNNEKKQDGIALLPNKFIRQRLEAFLGIFAAVTGPKQLYKHNLLFVLYHELVCKPDTTVAKLAFECILTYKPIYVTPYKDNVRQFFDDKTFRNELLTMRIDGEENAIDDETIVKEEHKPELFPLLIRILFGRLLAKPSNKRGDKDQNVAKRSAVLSFIAKMDGVYAKHILYLMIRGILLDYIDLKQDKADASESKAVQDYLADGFSKVYSHVMEKGHTNQQTFSKVSWERFQGFLFLLQPVISILGFRLTKYVPVLEEIMIQILTLSHSSREKSLEDLRSTEEEHNETNEDQTDDIDANGDGEEESDEDEEGDHEHDHKLSTEVVATMKTAKHASAARTLVLLRFAELVEIFHAVHNFEQGCDKFFSITKPLLESLKTAVIGARKIPALLSVISQLSHYGETVHLIAKNDFVLRQTIQCISVSTTVPEIGKTIFAVLGGVLDYDRGVWMKPYAELIVQCFTARFQGKSSNYDPNAHVELKLSDIVVSNIGGARMELQLLCRLAEEIFVHKEIQISTLSASNLATLVLGLLRAYTNSKKIRIMEDWVINILRIYKTLLWRIQDVSNHAAFFSRLFGPTAHSASLFNAPVVRQELVAVFEQLGTHKSVSISLKMALDVIHKLTKPDESILESRDYATFIPVVQDLSKQEDVAMISWSKVLGPASHAHAEIKRPVSSHIALCAAPAFELIRCMYDKELAVRAAAIPALKSLISCSIAWYHDKRDRDWLNILTAILIPAVRKGIQSSTDTVKNGFLAVFAHLVKSSQSLEDNGDGVVSDSFHKDLGFLLHEDDPEQDFFENITHIQLHRRARAFMRMKVMLQQQFQATVQGEHGHEQEDVSKTISVASYVHILLPLLFHYLTSDEFSKKLHQNLLQDVTQLIGAISLHLPWNHYHALFKKTLKILERASESKEKMMQTVLCTILDNFHFDLSQSLRNPKSEGAHEDAGEDAEQEQEAEVEQDQNEDKKGEDEQKDGEKEESEPVNQDRGLIEEVDERTIASVVVRTILPSVKYHLVKTVKDHHGDKTQTVQSNIALALTNLIKRLEPPAVKPQVRAHLFTNLVIGIVGTLKSKDSDIRDAARHCLAKMVMILGMNTLRSVVYELQSILKEGYQKHVSLYTVKTLLGTILENYSPPISQEEFPSLNLEQLAAVSNSPEELAAMRPTLPDFDQAIPMIMNSVLDDISEETKQDREAEGGIRTNVMREMKGSKFNEILELVARSLLFRPTYALTSLSDPAAASSIHAVSTPLLHALHHFYDQNYFGNNSTEHFQTLSGRIAEGLQRVAIGLAKNPSVQDKELLLYLHATLQPFVVTMMNDYRRYKDAIGQISLAHAAPSGRSEKRKKRLKAAAQPGIGGSSSNLNAVLEEEEGDDFELDLPSYLRGESSDEEGNKFASERNPKKRAREENAIKRYKAAQWLPREWRNTPSATAAGSKEEADKLERRAVIEERDRIAQEQFRVQDGASAPRLTGRNRYDRVKQQEMMSRSATAGIDKSTLIAIKYCLTLLYSSLKKGIFQQQDNEIQSMLLPFIPLLRSFLYVPGASEVVTLSVKCISSMLQWGVKIDDTVFTQLTNRILLLMLQSGKAMVTKDNELCQACMQGLVVCFKRYNEKASSFESGTDSNNKKAKKPEFPLSELKVRVLIEMMTVSMMEITSNYQHPAFHLIKEIINAKIVLPEIYDLVNGLTEQIVLSHRQGIRDMASSILVQFMLVYPMSKDRFNSHVQVCLRNVSYEYEEGRISALETLHLFIKTFPSPVIEEYANVLFLPMTLKLVNEKVSKCRQVVVKVLSAMLKKIQSKDLLTQFQDYSVKWLHAYLFFVNQVETHQITPSTELQAFHTAMSKMKVGSQIIGIFFQARPDIWNQRTDYIREVIKMIYDSILRLLKSYKASKVGEDDEMAESQSHQNKSDIGSGHWNAFYHLLLLVDTLYVQIPSSADYAITHLSVTNKTISTPAVSSAASKKASKKHHDEFAQREGGGGLLRVILHELVLFPHVWVRSVSLRILESYFKRRPITVNSRRISPYEGNSQDTDYEEILVEKNMLYHMGRSLAIILNQNMLPMPLEESAVNATVYIIRMMIAHSELDIFSASTATSGEQTLAEEDDDLELIEGGEGLEELDNEEREVDHQMEVTEEEENGKPSATEKKNKYLSLIKKNQKQQEQEDEEDEDDEEDDEASDVEEEDGEEETKDAESTSATKQDKRGITWMMQRLRAIGADIRGNRRRHVLKVFHTLVKSQSLDSITLYLPQILEVPIRIMLSKIITEDNPAEEQMQTMLKEESTELLRHVENKMGAIEFMGIFSEIQRKVEKIKHDKKRRMKAEAVSNPAAYAKKKMEKNLHKKMSKKRKTLQHMAIKGLKRRKSNEDNHGSK